MTDAKPPQREAEFVYIWQFAVKPNFREQFERHYGPNSVWDRLFRQAPGYLATLLLKDAVDPHRYVTVDRWQSRELYEAFRRNFAEEYAAVDRICEEFTVSESNLGEYRRSI